MRHIIPISGKDSLATAIVQMRLEPELPYEFVYNDTRMELPETYEWIKLVESTMGITIHRAGKSLEQIIYGRGFYQALIPSPLPTVDSISSGWWVFFIGEDYPLLKIRQNAEALFSKRVSAITKWLVERTQKDLFADALIDDMELAQKSCGLYCGK